MFHKNSFLVHLTLWMLTAAALLGLTLPAAAAPLCPPDGLEDRLVLPVYWQPDPESTVIGNLEDRTDLEVTGETEDFYQIRLGETCGYVPKNGVSVDDNICYYVNCRGIAPRSLPCIDGMEMVSARRNLLRIAKKHLGTPYVWGGKAPGGFDCSGFVQYVFSQAGFQLNRTATAQLENTLIIDDSDLLPGDLVFFENTDNLPGIVSHVGIFVGAGLFIHAASGGITYSSLKDEYYEEHFLWGRRVILPGVYPYCSLLSR